MKNEKWVLVDGEGEQNKTFDGWLNMNYFQQ